VVGGGDDPHVDLLHAAGAHGLDLALLQRAHSFGCSVVGSSPISSSTSVPSVASAKNPRRAWTAPGERAARVPEQLGVGQLGGDRGAV